MPEDNPRDKGISQRELEMVAEAMIEMFGDDAPNKAMSRSRLGPVGDVGNHAGRRFQGKAKHAGTEG